MVDPRTLLLASLISAATYGGHIIEPSDKSRDCQHEKCGEMASLLNTWRNRAVRPCDDFYNYVCGGFKPATTVGLAEHIGPELIARDIIDTSIKDSLHTIDSTDPKVPIAIRRAKAFHSNCIRCDPTKLPPSKEVIEYFNNFAHWPYLTRGDWQSSAFDVHKTAGRLFGELGVVTIASLYIDSDRSQVNQKVLIMREPMLADTQSLNRVKVALQPSLKLPYVAKVTKILNIVADSAGIQHPPNEVAQTANEIVDFEIDLSQNIIDSIFADPNSEPVTTPVSLTDLMWGYAGGKPSWTSFLQAAFRYNEEGQNWLLGHKVKLAHTEYFAFLYAKLLTTPPKIVANYMMVKLLTKLGPYINESLPSDDSRRLNLNPKLRKRESDNAYESNDPTETREAMCIGQLKKFFPEVAARLYVEKRYHAGKKKSVKQISDDVVNAMEAIFQENSWLSAAAKDRFKAKLRQMQLNLGFPDWILDDAGLNRVQSQSYGDQLDNRCFTSSMAYRKWDFSALLRDSSVRNEFQLPITSDRDSVYMLNLNALTIPAGSMEFPFYTAPQAETFNYALVGFIIGHEISHGFDNLGVFYNGNGVRNNDLFTRQTPSLLGAENQAKFKEMSTCLTDAYGKNCFLVGVFNWTQKHTCVDGARTLGENIADITGLKAAFKAYKTRSQKPEGKKSNKRLPLFNEYSQDQMFFHSYASQWCTSVGAYNQLLTFVAGEHSPNKARVNEVLRQTPEFAKAFRCQLGQPMVSPNVCPSL